MGYSAVAVCRLLIAVASLIAEHRLQAMWVLVAGACGLSCFVACGILPAQGSNLALQGGFLITEPPGKSSGVYY